MATAEPTREQVDAFTSPTFLEFGAAWCGICQGARPLIETALSSRPEVAHLKIEDGPGRRLGRSFRVKLWPTLVFLAHGREVARVVRPRSTDELYAALAQLSSVQGS